MAVRKSSFVLTILLLAFLAGARPIHAQEDQQPPAEDKPKPAGASFPGPGGDQQDQNEQTTLTPDTTPLTGILSPTLGSPEVIHSYWVPGVQLSGTIQSHSYGRTQSQNSGWSINNYVVGTVSLLKVWGRSQLALNYSGGGFFSSDSSQGNGSYQQLAATQSFQWNRWQLQLVDQFSYLPQSSLGFGGGTGLGIPGTGGSLGGGTPGLGNNYNPNQSIYAAVGSRYSNTSAVQTTYATSPRGSITMSGSYSILNFIESGNVNDQSTTASVGYNYALTRNDTIGAFYLFSAFHFSHEPQAYGSHSANFAYGRKLTGRLALQLFGGPAFNTARVSANGDNVSHGVNAGANLTAGFENGGVNLSYSHGISGGSGVIAGSSTDQLNVGANRRVGRVWTCQVNMGYAHNTPIHGFGPTTSQAYNTWNFGGGVSRPLGKTATAAIAYSATVPDYNVTGCTGTGCPSNKKYNYITLNFQWHTRPLILP